MEKNWTKIRTYSNTIEAEIVKQMLEENNIPAVILNKQDSSYHFGRIELYVNESDKIQALELTDDINVQLDEEDIDVN